MMNNSIDKNRITSVKISSNLKQHSVLLALCTEGGFQWMQVKGGWYDINGKTEDFPAQTCEVIYADKEKTHASVKITLPEIAFLWDETSPVICKLQLHPAEHFLLLVQLFLEFLVFLVQFLLSVL